MDINDALRRVVMRHAWLIALCALLPAVAVFLLSPSGHSYASDARIAVASEVPRSNQEADALAAQVEAQTVHKQHRKKACFKLQAGL